MLVDVHARHPALPFGGQVDGGTTGSAAYLEHLGFRTKAELVGKAQPFRSSQPAALAQVLAIRLLPHRGFGAAGEVAVHIVIQVDSHRISLSWSPALSPAERSVTPEFASLICSRNRVLPMPPVTLVVRLQRGAIPTLGQQPLGKVEALV